MPPENTPTMGMTLKYQHCDSIDSTNRWGMSCIGRIAANEIHIFSASHQTHGRGQGDHRWDAEAGVNILASFAVTEPPVLVTDQFSLSHVIALAAREYVQKELPSCEVKIKWPNDIMVDGRKIAGILIENATASYQLMASVMGIGLNVNQKEFSAELPNAVSLFMLDGQQRTIETELQKLTAEFVTQYEIMLHGRPDILHHLYDNHLLGKGQQQAFLLNGQKLLCTIIGTDPDGKIQLRMPDGTSSGFYHHEIEWVKL